jgi:hypothetical protein
MLIGLALLVFGDEITASSGYYGPIASSKVKGSITLVDVMRCAMQLSTPFNR